MTTETPIDDESNATLTDPAPIEGDHPGGPRHDRPPFPAVAAGVDAYLTTDFSGHDMHHVWRVFRLTQRFADELNADHDVVGCAALTHDIHRVLGDGTGCDPEETLTTVAHILKETELDEAQIRAVEHCVAVHDDLAFRGETPEPETIEAKILRDADNLDAMGAVGIARTFAFGGVHGTPLWDPSGEQYSQLYHFEDKLLRLRDELHTDPARTLAEQRHAFLEAFYDRFQAEWHGRA
ncbi:HD domain-containing protein [Halocatena pleomorpha]|uniref:HD domain-containing protein n=1 Tax=Halocatena pleomorpha TaxID=1785090 RepID=A0A3P3REC2_9EURY|nr:HD domain-containing protein [Halocatena pleomorpha]RRJ31852.1 HD domain-containing protein [Halocatena pleomorpha]